MEKIPSASLRADAADFTGDLTEREYEQSVEANGTKDYSYTMIFD